jgi:hypothetical protein
MEAWQRFEQYVSIADAPDETRLSNMRFQFMFPNEETCTRILIQLPVILRSALQDGTLFYRGVACDDQRLGAGWVQFGWENVSLSIGEGKQLLNEVVSRGGEIYEAFLT